MPRRVAAAIRLVVSVRAACVRARAPALDRVICDVSGPIGCHLSADADVSLPFPLLSRFLSLSSSLPQPPVPFLLFLHLCLLPPPDATRERNPIRAVPLPPATLAQCPFPV